MKKTTETAAAAAAVPPAMQKQGPSTQTIKDAFDTMVKMFVTTAATSAIVPEFEIRFGTRKPISKIDYNNVVARLLASGYTCDHPAGLSLLRVYPMLPTETTPFDPFAKKSGTSRLRLEIKGIEVIEEYCQVNDELTRLKDHANPVMSHQARFTVKTNVVEAVAFPDFGFKASYQNESHTALTDSKMADHVAAWPTYDKTYRFMNRVRFKHPTLPFSMDLSIVRSSTTSPETRKTIPQKSLRDAKVFAQQESYEIELEIDHDRLDAVTTKTEHGAASLIEALRHHIRMVMSGLQQSPFPIGYSEMKRVLMGYLDVLHGPGHRDPDVDITSKDFIGPNSVTLQIHHLAAATTATASDDVDDKNVRRGYCVTEKADGLRSLLYVHPDDRLYLIDVNMSVTFTGMTLANFEHKAKFHKSVLDGEFIKHNAKGEILNCFAAFDIYYYQDQCVAGYWFDHVAMPLLPTGGDENAAAKLPPTRLALLREFVATLQGNLQTSVGSTFHLLCKAFKQPMEKQTIFQACREVLRQPYPYLIDGLIFTPLRASVGGMPGGPPKDAKRLVSKITWGYSFKWKPPQHNTIDFYVRTLKDADNKDLVRQWTSLETGEIRDYKTLILHCGYNQKNSGFYKSPLLTMIDDAYPSIAEAAIATAIPPSHYVPVPFEPAMYDNDERPEDRAKFCHVLLKNGLMMTEQQEYFEDGMIVEFKYHRETDAVVPMLSSAPWRWVPLRVRYDKTAELYSSTNAIHAKYGNDFEVANNNWNSIHRPITQEMIAGMVELPSLDDSDVYYDNNPNQPSATKAMRRFHNLHLKKMLIQGAANVVKAPKTLIDFAVGKAGDLNKWESARLDFVFGIDLSRDNIENRKNGACARYVDLRTTKAYIKHFKPQALFVKGDSSKNLRDGSAFKEEGPGAALSRYADMAQAVFGKGPREESVLGKGVFKHYGVGRHGFSIASCQFAIHYFFKDKATIHAFLRNVAECTALHGIFMGTCFDGVKVFNLLKPMSKGTTFTLRGNGGGDGGLGPKIFELTKEYDQQGFDGDSYSCLGYKIHVFQETINKVFAEYLVHFDYLTKLMQLYGFEVVDSQTADKMGLPNKAGIGSFEAMAKLSNMDVQMSPEEKKVSFLNGYFVFQKRREVDVVQLWNEQNVTPLPDVSKMGPSADAPKTTTVVLKRKKGVKMAIVSPNQENPKKPAVVDLTQKSPEMMDQATLFQRFRLIEINPDGNCLFRAFAAFKDGDENNHATYRAMVCQFYQKHTKYLTQDKNNVENEDDEFLESVRLSLLAFPQDDPAFRPYDAIKNEWKICKDMEWGTTADILVLSRLLNLKVVVFSLDISSQKFYSQAYDQFVRPDANTMYLHYNGINHYHLLTEQA